MPSRCHADTTADAAGRRSVPAGQTTDFPAPVPEARPRIGPVPDAGQQLRGRAYTDTSGNAMGSPWTGRICNNP
jgi:hypothetical protein